MHSCGGCRYFTRMKSMVGNSGLCDLKDVRTSEDSGHKCNEFKHKKYIREKKNNGEYCL